MRGVKWTRRYGGEAQGRIPDNEALKVANSCRRGEGMHAMAWGMEKEVVQIEWMS
jgi:hypothetical protein